jgi:uncharacterized membrane protein
MSRPTLLFKPLPLVLVVASWALLAVYWGRLPDPVPSHWGLDGRPDRWTRGGALIGPASTTFLYLFFAVLPRLDPRLERRKGNNEVCGVIQAITTAFCCYLTFLTLDASTRPDAILNVSALWGGLGVVLVVLGNYLPKLRSNFFMGIRTPWTLSSEEVWYQTHRVGGRVMVAGGLLVLLGSFLPFPWGLALAVVGALVPAVGITIYSYVLYRRLG